MIVAAVWLVIHTTTVHAGGVMVQSVRAVQHQSQGSCARAIIDLAARDIPSSNKVVIRFCTPQQPSWWIGGVTS